MAHIHDIQQGLATKSMVGFVYATMPSYVMGWVHEEICAELDAFLADVVAGKSPRLMLTMPPRHGKTELASRRFPAYVLGRYPDMQIISTSYSADLATRNNKDVQRIIESEAYSRIFSETRMGGIGARASGWQRTSDYFEIVGHKGSVRSAGVGGGITGMGGSILIIDDPFKDRQEADSETQRENVWDWYTSTLYTRLAPGGGIVVINTRWHMDDLSGRLLEMQANGEGDTWRVVNFPAIADADEPHRKAGEALHPERYSLEQLESIRAAIGPRDWNALYQQRPAPDEGAYFRREWMQTYDTLPPYLRYYGASDYAVTADGGDYTVHVLAGVDEQENIYLVDLWRGQTDALEWIDAWSNIVRMYKPQIWAEEGGVILKSLDPIIRKRCQEQRIFSTYRQQFASVADKPTRARSLQARMQMGKVFFPSPSRCPWVADLMAEMLTFPVGRHDDQVDALSLLTRMLAEMRPAKVPVPEKTLTQKVNEAAATPWNAHDLFENHFKKRREARAV